MADVLNKTTLEYRPSVNTPDYPETEWIHNPDKAVIESVGGKTEYLVVEGDTLRAMNDQERKQVNDAKVAARRRQALDELDAEGLNRGLFRWALEEVNAARSARGVAPLTESEARSRLQKLQEV